MFVRENVSRKKMSSAPMCDTMARPLALLLQRPLARHLQRGPGCRQLTKDFTPDKTGKNGKMSCKMGLLHQLSKFQKAGQTTDLAWVDVTCSDIESKTYQDADLHDSTETKRMAETLEDWASHCCGGKDKKMLPCSLAPASGLAVNFTLAFVLAWLTASFLQVPSG